MKRSSIARLARSFARLRRSERGNVLVLTAMGLPILIGGAGFGIDTAQWYLWQRELQTAVDAAALSGAYSRAQNAPYAPSAESELARNLNVASLKDKSVTLGNWTGGTNNAVTVAASTQRALPFSSIFLSTAPTIQASATAAVIDDGIHCMRSLEPVERDAVKVTGKALLSLGCGISSNSRGEPAIYIDGDAKVNASPLSAVGGIVANDANLIGDSTIRPYSTKQTNPFAGVTAPSNPAVQTYDKKSPTLAAGTYVGGLDLQASHTMEPGLYVIDGGTFKVNASQTLIGTGVTIVLKNGATLDIQGTSNLNLTASTATTPGVPANMVGMLIFEDQATAGTIERTSTINGNAKLNLGGAIYMPTQKVQINGNSEPTTECLLLVAKKIDVSGSTSIENTCPPGHIYPGDIGAKVVRLVK